MNDTINLNLDNLSKEELLEHIRKLTAHVKQLKNIIKKSHIGDVSNFSESTIDRSLFDDEYNQSNKKQTRKQREFDFSKYNRRHVALKFFYLGWDYEGFVTQEDTAKTIENAVFDALLKTKLITNRTECNYHRCGRTDKGVSAFSQVISIDLRSNSVTGKGIQTVEGSEVDGSKAEVNYCKILNKSLPPEIKFYCWADVEPGFSARFDCDRRTYRYFLPAGSLNVPAMQNAADRLIGLHDFRNFSKLDRTKLEQTFTRHIHAVCIRRLNETSDSNDLLVLEISGKAFLWHQIRCIVAILLLVGEEKEKPEIMSDLLDTELYARKPQYPLASELPLVLFDCGFDRIEPFDWIYDAEAIADAIDHLQSQYVELTTKTAIVTSMITELKALPITLPTIPLQKYLLPSLRSANHQPIATRPVSETQLSEVGEQRVRNNIKHRSIAKMIDYDQSEKKIKITPDVK